MSMGTTRTSPLFERHAATLEAAVAALHDRGGWSPYPEVPSGRFYGEDAKAEGLTTWQALLGKDFNLPGHPETGKAGQEVSPFGETLRVRYPAADADALVQASKVAAAGWAAAPLETRAGICLEILQRLNRASFLMAHATMHTSGQAFPMAFQAGGPHAQDRALEAVAQAWVAMKAVPEQAVWRKSVGKQEIVLDKHWRVVPRGVALCIGCQTFPTWNTYPGFFASLATGNTVIAKPHPAAILPMALTVRVAREVLASEGFSPDVVLLAAENSGGELAKALAQHADVASIDFTGSGTFAQWLRGHAATRRLFTEETGVNSVVVGATDGFRAMCDNLAFSLSLYSGQMCTSPQNIFVPVAGIDTDEGHKSFDAVAQGIADAVDRLLADPERALMVTGAIANPDTLARLQKVRAQGRVVRDSAPLAGPQGARTATPLMLAIDAGATRVHEDECFGPVSFVIAVDDVVDGVRQAAHLAREKGAITAALYDTDEDRIASAIEAFAGAGVNLSINLQGAIYVNQSAAFSDFHVTGLNPAGSATFADQAFVSDRFGVVMRRRPALSRP